MKYIFWAIFLVLYSFAILKNAEAQERKIKLVIDPGHGGKDPGRKASSSKYKSEEELTLIIALKVGEYIEKNLKNVEVIYTRKTDVFVSLEDRVSLANEKKADYFLSIHCNSNNSPSIYGTSTHIHSNKMPESKAWADLTEEDFVSKAGRKSIGVWDAKRRGHNLYVVQYIDMPGILVETGFLTNPDEEAYLNSEDGQVYTASSIYRAFKAFVGKDLKEREYRNTYYRIQVMASEKPVYLNTAEFQKLDMRVEEVQFENQRYKYKYYVGREYDLDTANELMKKVQQNGFKDAFVVKF